MKNRWYSPFSCLPIFACVLFFFFVAIDRCLAESDRGRFENEEQIEKTNNESELGPFGAGT